MTTAPITTLTQLLQQMGVQFRIYEMGRRIEKLEREQFEAVEALRKPYPRPYLQKAHFAVVFWHKTTREQPSVWFLRWPLDERGLLVLPERDRFIQHLLVAVGNNLDAAKRNEQLTAVLEGNPYVFQPPQEKQAAFNAKLKVALKLTPSQHFAHTLTFLQGDDYSQWHNLALQGLADVSAHHQQRDCHQALTKAIEQLPVEALSSLCQCLEHEAIDVELTQLLLQRLERGLDNPQLTAACLRGLSASVSASLVQEAVDTVLHTSTQLDIEVAATLATRLAPQLIAGANPLVFLEHLAQLGEQSFIGVMAELLYQPALREPFLAAMRLPERSEALTSAIGALLQPSQTVH